MSFDFAAVEDGCARTMADAIPDALVFAAGVTTAVTSAAPDVIPLADDFSEVGTPFVTSLIRDWQDLSQPMNERLHLTVECGIWRPRVDLPANRAALWTDLAAALEAFHAHAKGYLAEPHIQSSVVTGGKGPQSRSLPAAGNAQRAFLYLAFEVEIKTNRYVDFQAA